MKFRVTKEAHKPQNFACRNYNRVTGVEFRATSVAKNCIVFNKTAFQKQMHERRSIVSFTDSLLEDWVDWGT